MFQVTWTQHKYKEPFEIIIMYSAHLFHQSPILLHLSVNQNIKSFSQDYRIPTIFLSAKHVTNLH